MAQNKVSIARAYYEAYVSKDRAAIEALLSDGFHFTSPIDNQIDRATYFARCWPNSQTTEGIDFVHLVQIDDKVFVTYEAMSTNNYRFRNMEIVTVVENQVIDVEVYFGWSIPHKADIGCFIDKGD